MFNDAPNSLTRLEDDAVQVKKRYDRECNNQEFPKCYEPLSRVVLGVMQTFRENDRAVKGAGPIVHIVLPVVGVAQGVVRIVVWRLFWDCSSCS